MSFYERVLSDPRRERGFLSAAGFTAKFGIARAVTQSIDAVALFTGLLATGTAGRGGLKQIHSARS